MATISDILNEFCDRINQPRESSYVGNTTPGARQYVSLFKFIGQELLDNPNGWNQLKRLFFFQSYQGISNYQLPGDYERALVGTQWGVTNQIPLAGPLSNARLAFQTFGVNIATPFPGYQNNGAQGYKIATSPYTQTSAGYCQLSPTGQDNVTESVIAYTSNNYVWPQNWITNTAYTAGNIRTVQDEIWICVTNGTSANTGQFPKFGMDNNIIWQPILTYVVSELYFAGQYVFTGTDVYKVTVGGKSSAGTPSVTSGTETLGTVTFEYVSTPSNWVAGTTYEADDYVKTPTGAIGYKCLQGGVSGLLEPKFYFNLDSTQYAPPLISKRVLDGTAVWALYKEKYPITADTDFVILDSDLFVEGMRWAWYDAKQQFQAAATYKQSWENSVRSALGRQNGSVIVNAGVDVNSTYTWPVVQQGSWGNIPS